MDVTIEYKVTGPGLRQLKVEESLVHGLERADLARVSSSRLRSILEFAGKVTTSPASVDEGEVTALGEASLDDHEILDVAQVAGFFNYVNRLTEGLGLRGDR